MDDNQFFGIFYIFDLVLIIILLGSGIWGIVRGLVREIFALLSWVLSIWLTWKYGGVMGDYLITWISSQQISHYVGLGVVFIVSLFGFTVISKMVHAQFRITGLTVLNRLFGGIFGIIRGVILTALLLFVAQYSPAIETTWYRQSQLVPYLNPLSMFLEDSVSKTFWNSD